MDRTCITYLIDWLHSKKRKPLVIRGARQVGKTWLVRFLATNQGKELIEINFEKPGSMIQPFSLREPKKIVQGLEVLLGKKIDPQNTILFLDEIQAMPQAYADLRWFAEDMPELPVIAAGSLLEHALNTIPLSMPVGRVSFLFLEPLSFKEFLLALGKDQLSNLLATYNWQEEIPSFIHDELMRIFKEYILVGGIPEAVVTWIDSGSLLEVSRIQNNLLDTYRADIRKYTGRVAPERLEAVLETIPRTLGKKFVYRTVNHDVQTPSIKQALQLLCEARVAHKVIASSAHGLPLGAELHPKFFKVILLDVGLCSASLNLSYVHLSETLKIDLINKRGIAEQVVGQLLRSIEPEFIDPKLYYWQRAEKNSTAELDYVIQHEGSVIPIEVKSGTTGSLKSLHQFMELKNYTLAVRVNADLPSITAVKVVGGLGKQISYELRSIPLYLVSELHRLLD